MTSGLFHILQGTIDGLKHSYSQEGLKSLLGVQDQCYFVNLVHICFK